MNAVETAFQADSYVGRASEDLQETLPLVYVCFDV